MSFPIPIPLFWIMPIATFLATLLLTPFVITLARSLGAVDRGGFRRLHRRPVPRMGGAAIVAPFLLAGMTGLMLLPVFAPGILRQELAFLLAGGAFITALGMYDDLHQLQAKAKFLVQVLVALLVWAGGIRVQIITLPFLGTIDLGIVAGVGLTVLWIVGIINAFNLIDGVDGLATGLGLVSALGIAAMALLHGLLAPALLCLTLFGGLAGFLFFNYFPARIFLGDTGSLFIGYVLAVLSLMISRNSSGAVPLFSMVLLLAVPIFDTTIAIARRLLRGRSPFIGDSSHTHHRLMDVGFSQRQLTAILYGMAMLGVVAAFAYEWFSAAPVWSLPFTILFLVSIIALSHVCGYLRPRHARNIACCRTRNALLRTFARFAALSFRHNPSYDNMEDLLNIATRQMRLNFIEIHRAETGEPDSSEPLIRGGVLVRGLEDNSEVEPLQTMQVQDANGQNYCLRYQYYRPAGVAVLQNWDAQDADSLERQDVEACLAHWMSIVRLEGLQSRPSRTRLHSWTTAA